MGTIVAVANQKGGVGKTTLAVHLAAYLAARGRSVIVVDADPQGNATSWLLGDIPGTSALYNILVARRPLREQLVTVHEWGVRLLPGNWETGEAITFLVAAHKPLDTAARALAPLRDMADYVVLDMPPSRMAGFRELLFAADGLVVPTLLERLSVEGVVFMYRVVGELREEYGHAPRLLGIVPNMVRRTREHREQMQELVQTFGEVVWPPVPLSVRVAEASAYGENLFRYAPREGVTGALAKVCRRFLMVMEGDDDEEGEGEKGRAAH